MSIEEQCPFCDGPNDRPVQWHGEVQVFTPLNPVAPGHLLVVPREHVRDAGSDLIVTAKVFMVAAGVAANLGLPFNLITSAGAEATQSVFHLHVHIVPREAGDGLMLPWGPQ